MYVKSINVHTNTCAKHFLQLGIGEEKLSIRRYAQTNWTTIQNFLKLLPFSFQLNPVGSQIVGHLVKGVAQLRKFITARHLDLMLKIARCEFRAGFCQCAYRSGQVVGEIEAEKNSQRYDSCQEIQPDDELLTDSLIRRTLIKADRQASAEKGDFPIENQVRFFLKVERTVVSVLYRKEVLLREVSNQTFLNVVIVVSCKERLADI